MNNAQDMSPDFVLMRLVSAAEDDRLDEKNGNVSPGGITVGRLGKDVLTSSVKGGLQFAHPSHHRSSPNNAQANVGSTAPAAGVMATRPSLSLPPPPPSATEARQPGFEFSRRGGGLRPQLLVFPNILRDGEGVLDRDAERLNQPGEQVGLSRTPGSASDPSGGVNNNPLSAGDVQQQSHLSQAWGLHPQVTITAVAADIEGGGELCHRHRLITDSPTDWPSLLSEQSSPFTGIEGKWGCCPGAGREGTVFELARRFGELGVGAVPKLFKDGELPRCSCRGAHGAGAAGMGPGDDPTETSDALLVLEGLGTGDVSGLGMEDCPEDDDGSEDNGGRTFLLDRKREIVQKMSGTFSLGSFQVQLARQVEGVARKSCPSVQDGHSARTTIAGSQLSTSQATGSNSNQPSFSPNGSSTSTPRRRPERCASAPRTPTGRSDSSGDKTLKVPGKSRKGSLKTRLSKLFRTKSCSGSNNLLDKRPSVAYSVASAGSLLDVACASGGEQDTDSQTRLTRAHSAFSPASFSTFTGETVSLVDVDISRRGASTPHPPTPPAPPRRSLSLLDAFLRALPHPSPPPPDATLPSRLAPPPALCPLRRPEASNFTASLRELEKCGWYWGPMNWEDAEMKLKGRADGSFLVRDSSDPRYILSLSFRSQAVTHHTRMEHYRGTFSLWCHPKFEDRCHSVVEFIERAIMHSKNGKFLYFLRSRVPGLPPTPVQLLHPVSRFSQVKSLQHLCRFCIRQMVRIDHIQELPLPKPLISYLRKFYYYDPEEETDLPVKSACSVEAEPESPAQT